MYFGEIGPTDSQIQNISFKSQTNENKIKFIDDITASDIFCGPGMIALIDKPGYLYFYNELEKLYKVKIEKKITSLRFVNNNIYALSLNKDIIYEFILKTKNSISMKNNYYENIYKINPEFSSKFRILDLPFYNNLLFFTIGIYKI